MIKVYADAASNLFNAILKIKKCDVKIVSMTLDVNGKIYHCYEDNIDVDQYSKEFYDDMRKGADVKTSLANPQMWVNAFDEDVSKGNQVICFTLASGISGTYNAACLAAEMINEEYGKEMVHIVDSKTASLGEGMQALKACKLIDKGLSFEEVVKECEDYVLKVRSEFTVDDIKYIAKTGRVSKFVAKIASVLNIKVILKGGKDATINLAKKVHGRMKALKDLAETCVSHIANVDDTVYICHCDAKDDANILVKLLKKLGIKKVEVYSYDLITGSHAGPGTVAVFYEGLNRD